MKKKRQAQLSFGGVLLIVGLLVAQQMLGIDLLGEPTGNTQPSENLTGQAAPTDRNESRSTHAAGLRISEDAIRHLIDNEISGEMVTVEAEVVRVLPDDNDGSRHQRLLLALETGGTVLVSHNIDLAPRVPIEEGEAITVRGQYEFNDKGGVIHWTHHDPKDWREGGWIELEGKRYE